MKAIVAFWLALCAVAMAHEHKPAYAAQQFRYSSSGIDAADGKSYALMEPYLPLGFGVVQLEGAKHREHEIMTCVPDMIRTDNGTYTKLVCDDGSQFAIAVIVFPRKQ